MILEQSSVDLQTSSGPMRQYVYRPQARGRRPGIVLFSEIFQRTGPIGRMAALLAGHGYVVAVPEIFHELEPAGTVLGYDQAGADAGNHHKVAKTTQAYDEDARVAAREEALDQGGEAFEEEVAELVAVGAVVAVEVAEIDERGVGGRGGGGGARGVGAGDEVGDVLVAADASGESGYKSHLRGVRLRRRTIWVRRPE